MTMLKFLNQEGRYTYVASGSQLGVAKKKTMNGMMKPVILIGEEMI